MPAEVSSRAEGVLAGAAKADAALNEISTQVSAASADSELLAVTAKGVANAVQDLTPAFQRLAQGLRATVSGVHQANSRAEEIVDISERAVQVAVQLGAANADGFMIELVQDNAATISAQFEAALQSGVLNEAQLFSSTYAAIPGTDPQQVVAPFTEFTDRILPAIQEPILGKHPRIVFCAAVDRNGYLPTHNAAFSRPQTTDPVWNAAHSRNRRVFDDRVGLKSGRNRQPFLMQTYRRDMGGGTFVLMKDVSAPIFVRGRHWGGLRMGFKPAE